MGGNKLLNKSIPVCIIKVAGLNEEQYITDNLGF